jgi:hypothetical protein
MQLKELEKIILEDRENNISKEIDLKSDIIKKFKLTLKDNTTVSIPVRSDGYVNVTALCKASNKRVDNWKVTKESKELLNAFKAIPGNQGIAYLDVVKG